MQASIGGKNNCKMETGPSCVACEHTRLSSKRDEHSLDLLGYMNWSIIPEKRDIKHHWLGGDLAEVARTNVPSGGFLFFLGDRGTRTSYDTSPVIQTRGVLDMRQKGTVTGIIYGPPACHLGQVRPQDGYLSRHDTCQCILSG